MSNSRHAVGELTQFALDAIRNAGKQALGFYGKGKPQVKFDTSLVTEAELMLADSFEDQLKAHFPNHLYYRNNFDGDEYTHDDKRFLWIFDPLDGAANLQAGIPIWGLSLALLENFWPVLGVIYMPATGDLFHAKAGEQAYRGESPLQTANRHGIDDEGLLLTYSRYHQYYKSTFPGKVRNFGCTVAHICYVAMGRADAALVAKETYQDLIAAWIFLEAAGGQLRRLDGEPFSLNAYLDGNRIEEPLLALAPGVHKRIAGHIQPLT